MDELDLSYVVLRQKEVKDSCMSSPFLDLIDEGNGHWLFKRTNVNPITQSEHSMEASPPIEFNFTKKIDFKVSLSRSLSERTITQQGFSAKVVGNDPAMHFMLNTPINGRDYNHVVVDMRITPSVKKKEIAQLFWRTTESKSFSEENSLRFVIQSDGRFHRYTIPLSERLPMEGDSNIDMIRFDPTNDCPCFLEIKSIVFSNALEERETQQTDSN